MKALILNCTLKRSLAPSNTTMLADEVVAGLEERGVECETVRLVDLNILPGVSSDEGEGDEWPMVREKTLATSIVILATPTWLGQMSSVAKRALERMDAMLSEQNEAGQMITYNRVVGSVVTGNEDGAKHCIAEMQAAMTEIGFCAPPLAYTYWNMGPGPGPEYPDTDHGKEWSKTTATACAHNLYNVARALEKHPNLPKSRGAEELRTDRGQRRCSGGRREAPSERGCSSALLEERRENKRGRVQLPGESLAESTEGHARGRDHPGRMPYRCPSVFFR